LKDCLQFFGSFFIKVLKNPPISKKTEGGKKNNAVAAIENQGGKVPIQTWVHW
jgi:hypothetical protein